MPQLVFNPPRHTKSTSRSSTLSAVFRSPAVHTPQEGKALVTAYLSAAMVALGPTLAYQQQWIDESCAVLKFTPELDHLSVHGVDMIRWDADGKVTDFTVMVRPFKALTKLMELMATQLQGAASVDSQRLDA